MTASISSPIKINLILRVFSKLPNGYHEIYSLFWQKNGREKLTIHRKYDEITGDSLRITGMDIAGDNLVVKALAAARGHKDIPPLDITLDIFFPTGCGIGAGSGNAGALLKWLEAEYRVKLKTEEKAQLGADVAFLASGDVMAEAHGIGERMTAVTPPFDYKWLLVFPRWRSGTKEAYVKLVALREGRKAAGDGGGAFDARVIEALSRKEKVGLMPNDFYEVSVSEHREYVEAEKTADATGARGWGLCGSGSAFFALYEETEAAGKAASLFSGMCWTLKTYIVE